MDRWRGRVALVTGASSGIGAAVAKQLVQHGMKVVGCARNYERIQELATECQQSGYTGLLVPYKCDLSNEEEILSMFSAITKQHGGVDVCVNNAGLAYPDSLLSGKTSSWSTMLQVNVIAVAICTREAYRSMRERNVNDGHIININSMSGHRVPASSTVHFYSATKYAVTALTEGLRQELHEANTQIRATVNVIALSICTREAYQSMRERNVNDGHIININSMSGHRVTPAADVHFYSATKYAVTALTEGLRQELHEANTQIRATCISPGLVCTEFLSRMYTQNPEKGSAFGSVKCLEAIDVSSAVMYVLSAPPHVQIGDIQMRHVEQKL
ncbi:hypothetical protein NHX12_009162 [Muraenolepis orangiensis]|uniref:Dehydrogenase/reductase SDR family member 11 n=1 Tax=Muraenolepis orangiensis TaxID=630683 RepID=A0A9Q0DQ92_9TELE|nr:hypothetical protein NHX12_009162 [Muraenolepis orangiensis]